METGLIIKELADKKIDLHEAIQRLQVIVDELPVDDYQLFRAEVLGFLTGLIWAMEQDPSII